MAEFNPTLAFIETDDLEQFVADGGSREVRYEDDGFRFAYKLGDRWISFTLPDEENDPSARERLILAIEANCLRQLRKTRDGPVSEGI